MAFNSVTSNIFQEAISHCRWSGQLKTHVIPKINPASYSDKTFEETLKQIYGICKPVRGVGLLSAYDLAAAVHRVQGRPVGKVYIIGGGPQRAVKLLNLKTKTQHIGTDLSVKYVEIDDVKRAFTSQRYTVSATALTTTNGDVLESYLCKWQKGI